MAAILAELLGNGEDCGATKGIRSRISGGCIAVKLLRSEPSGGEVASQKPDGSAVLTTDSSRRNREKIRHPPVRSRRQIRNSKAAPFVNPNSKGCGPSLL